MKIIKGIMRPKAYRVVVYGVEGIGKTTLASRMPEPLFLDVENGTHGMDVAKVDVGQPVTFQSVMGIVNELIRDHQGYRTLVIDSLDFLEKRLTEQICEEKGKECIEDVAAYGKGYVFMGDRFKSVLDKLSDLADSGMNVVCIGHSFLRTQSLPDDMGAFERYELKLHQKQVAPYVKAWCDTLVFLNYKTNLVEDVATKKSKAQGGKRWAYFDHSPTFDAKHRVSMPAPEDCPMDKAVDVLAQALSGTDGNAPAEKPVQTARRAANPPSDAPAEQKRGNVPPHVERLLTSISQYAVTEEQIRAYAEQKLVERYGMKDAAIADWPRDFCDWLTRGMEKISQKIRQ